MKLAFATSHTQQTTDSELTLIAEAARQLGAEAQIVVWDDPSVDWSCYDAVVIRSCWDYVARREEFLAWVGSVPRIHNSHRILTWNTDKTYLRQLQQAGIPIIDTQWNVQPGDDIGAHEEWVVKPAISAGSQDTARWSTREQVWAHSAQLIAAGRTSMTQRYIASVDRDGETALMYFDGTFSHSISKAALLKRGEGVVQDRDSRETITPRQATSAQQELGQTVLATTRELLGLDEPPLYARIDLVTADDGSDLLIELELAEPSLFLAHSNGGAIRLIEAAIRRAAN